MLFNRFLFSAIFVLFFLVLTPTSFAHSSTNPTTESLEKFSEYSETSIQKMDFSVVDKLLHAGVINMGPSTRAYARVDRPSTGTRFRQTIDGATENEANRFFYETLHDQLDQILILRQELEAIPTATPLNQYTKEAQLAYWLNLYKVALIYEIAGMYPLNDLRPVLTGDNSILDEKILVIDNVSLSLNDIHYRVVPLLYSDDPFYIYGFHQGVKGSPNVRQKAYTEKNVIKNLANNAREFINSNRGTQFNGGDGVVRVSSFYERNAELFQDFDKDVKSHLLRYGNRDILDTIESASTIKANIDNWRINDLYGSTRRRDYGLLVSSGNGTRLATGDKLSAEQANQLQNLLRVRAINFGGGSVTVTDLPSKEETSNKTDDNSEKQ